MIVVSRMVEGSAETFAGTVRVAFDAATTGREVDVWVAYLLTRGGKG